MTTTIQDIKNLTPVGQTALREWLNPMLLANQTHLVNSIQFFLEENDSRDLRNAEWYDIERFREDAMNNKDLLKSIRQYLWKPRHDIKSITDEEIADYIGSESLDDYMNDQEVMERWLVDSRLCKQLADRWQPILETWYETRWGRTCTGQAVYLDSIMTDIYLDSHNLQK